MKTYNTATSIVAVAITTLSLWLPAAEAQSVRSTGGRTDASVNSEMERYLRLLQVSGSVRLYPWSVRGFSPAELDALLPVRADHPWADRYLPAPLPAGGPRLELIRPEGRVIYNSAFPSGRNDGAIWAGRGVTTAVRGGISAGVGPISLELAPIFIWAQNQPFTMMDNGGDGRLAFAHATHPRSIDLPQRFGDESYVRLDLGQSTLRLDLLGAAVGLSTANQYWGPALDHPLLLGNHAPGFLHAFLGTSAPVNLGIGRLHGRVVYGALEQSEYAFLEGAESRRFMSGVVAVFTPGRLPGVEIGAARFFHDFWPEEGLEFGLLGRPLGGLFKRGLPDTGTEIDGRGDGGNQLASVFARATLPSIGLETYVEYARMDHAWDLLDLILQPDHAAGYMIGARKSWKTPGRELVALRAEILNTQASHLLRARARSPTWGGHSQVRQGHTHRGQMLGSAAAFGGGGSVLAGDVYHAGGRWTVEWSRTRVKDRGQYAPLVEEDPRFVDMLHEISAEGLFFRRGGMEVTAGIAGAYNLNRDFESDVFNLRARLGVGIGF